MTFLLCAVQEVPMPRAQGRAGRIGRGSGGPSARRAGAPRMARPGLSSAAGRRSDESAGAAVAEKVLDGLFQQPAKEGLTKYRFVIPAHPGIQKIHKLP